jgi:two-component system, CAI-1 autoinducer sensor kinase/phosphatase CqsS
MYSLLPAVVSGLFFSYGIYVLVAKGITRLSTIFFLHCLTTCFWQGILAVLFQTHDPLLAGFLVKIVYAFIIFLPTTLYHFFVEISDRQEEHRWVYLSYGLSVVLVGFDLASNLFVDGYYIYFWGYYPKAGMLHPLHLLQTAAIVYRGLHIVLRQERIAVSNQRIRLRICLASSFVYSFAAIDYVCNYGIAIYPLGAIFTALSLGLLSVAVTRYGLMSGLTVATSVAATIAHEIRTPLATIGLQSNALAQHLSHLYEGYQRAVSNGLIEAQIDSSVCESLIKIPQKINHQINRSNTMIDMMLASTRMEYLDTKEFAWHSARACTAEALDTYPFTARERAKVTFVTEEDFKFYGSESLFVFVIFNLLKNALYAIAAVNKGDICISISAGKTGHILRFTDTASGIPPSVLNRIFDTFYTTKQSAGTGIGLAFCQRVMKSFYGDMRCESVEGQYTTFTLSFTPGSTATGRKSLPLLSEHAA